jgi:hypothetical protein
MTFSRRRILTGTAAALWSPMIWTPERAGALRTTLARSAKVDGTTLVTTVVRPPGPGYVRLSEGPGWPTLPRTELAALRSGRDDRRRPLAAIVHLTDVHLVDAQSPGRVEFLDAFGEPFTGAYRPQELLTTQVQSSMVQRIREVGVGPVTGRPLDCAVSTGDNIDNCQHNELDWFIGVLDGREVTPNSGDPEHYEGVQAWADPRYWHPEGGATDQYRDGGFPAIPGLLDAAIRPHSSPGLDIPWYSTYGNHDGLIQGNLPRTDDFDEILTAVGTAYCWGSNNFGQVGDGTETPRGVPVPVVDAGQVTDIATGEAHACAVVVDGTVRCWGNGFDGQLGNDPAVAVQKTAVPVAGLTGVIAVTGGNSHTCARRGADGSVACWGLGTSGQLGTGSTTSSLTPVEVPGVAAKVVEIGAFHSCAVRTDDHIVCWGSGTSGQLGHGLFENSPSPVGVSGL